MLRNLKAIYAQEPGFPDRLDRSTAVGRLESAGFDEQRDLGMLCLQLDRPADSIIPLRFYLDSNPAGGGCRSRSRLLRAARREVATWN